MKKLLLLAAATITACTAMAQAPDYGLTRLSQLTYNGDMSNCWGYVAPDGTEYALMGNYTKFSIVSLADPANPVEVASVPGPSTIWRENKVWSHYMYGGMDNVNVGLQIIDLANLPNSVSAQYFTPTIGGVTLASVHDVQVDSSGYLYLSGTNISNGAVLIFDLNQDPANPVYLGTAGNEYSHDNYVRRDTMWSSDIYAGYFSVWDVSNKANPVRLATQTTPNNFSHNAWLTNDSRYLLTTDERADAYVGSYDVSDLSNIRLVDQWRSKNAEGQGVIPHNVHILDNYAYVSYYTDGLKVLDAHRPTNLVEVASFDTYPGPNVGGFFGDWGVFPYFPSGTVIASDINTGLHVFQPNLQRACYLEGMVTDSITNATLSGVLIQILTTPEYDNSRATGEYATGYGISGTYQVVYSLAGYYPDTVTVSLQHGVVNIQNVALLPMTSFAYSGRVVEQGSNTPIPNAKVRVKSDNFTFNVVTDANGNFNINSLYADTYDIRAGKWGWHSNEVLAQSITNGAAPVTVELPRGYFDDFSMDLGWTVTTTASSGDWERTTPIGSNDGNGGLSAPNADGTQIIGFFSTVADIGTECYVTGNGGDPDSPGQNDVDNGYTILTSPVIPAMSANQLYFNYWFRNFGGQGGTPNDSLVVEYSENGGAFYPAEVIAINSTQVAAWRSQMLGVPTSNDFQIRFRVMDASPGHVVEAGIDDVYLELVAGTTSPNNPTSFNLSPNPFEAYTTIQYDLGQTQETDLIVTDLLGHVVEAQHLSQSQGAARVGENLPKGIYLVKIGQTVKKIVKM